MNENMNIIQGIVIPVNWDKKGNVVDAAIFTRDEDEFFIEKNKKGKELLDFLHKELEVSGLIKEIKGKKTVTISTYNVLKKGGE